MGDEKAVKFLTDMGVLSPPEIESRHHVAVERYVKTWEIELNAMIDMVTVIRFRRTSQALQLLRIRLLIQILTGLLALTSITTTTAM